MDKKLSPNKGSVFPITEKDEQYIGKPILSGTTQHRRVGQKD